ncbi:MAG TPA: hypothetical protein VKI19_06005 [Acidimicrobiales bacterium]|nr:hypothetical protein [Acidimicrobiales bacterium]
MLSKARIGSLAAATTVLASLAAYGAPAQAASVAITFATATPGGTDRTLNVFNSDGSAISSPLNVSSGSGGFIAQVVDNGIDPAVLGNFDVEATMTNLYKVTGGSTFDCGTTIPSHDVNMTSLPSLLDAKGLGSVLQPVLSLTGSLSSVIPPSLVTTLSGLGITVNLTPTVTGVTDQVTTTLTQAQEAAGSAGDLLGNVLSNGSLPINLSVGAGSAFTNPDAPPAGWNCPLAGNAPAATSVQVLHGALNGLPPAVTSLADPLLADLQTVFGNPTVSSLTSGGTPAIDPSVAESDIAAATNIPLADLTPSLLTSIENALTATVTGVVDGVDQISGTYGASPVLRVTPPNPTTPGTYQAVVTLTLTSNTQ